MNVFSAYQVFSFFVIYSFFGWCLEVVYQAVEHGKFINRGFLNGPYCPIYGFGAVIVVSALLPISDNILVLYVGSVVLTSALELVTGFVLEKIFNQHWWDYSDEKFNIGGYICLKFSLLWGVACLIVVRIIHPIIYRFVDWIPHTLGVILLSVIYIGFVSDFMITVSAILKIRKKIRILENISAEMRKISDKTGEKLFSGVETIRSKSEEWNEKNAQLKKRLEELAAKYKKLSEEKGFNGRRLEHSFRKLRLFGDKNPEKTNKSDDES
ncbi:MAG: hypothetical protein NC093_02990 [Alistipes sp.]|nr:hypothetical protein [Alistipes sp.]